VARRRQTKIGATRTPKNVNESASRTIESALLRRNISGLKNKHVSNQNVSNNLLNDNSLRRWLLTLPQLSATRRGRCRTTQVAAIGRASEVIYFGMESA
jgi:hypothetical protein